jgi:cell division transport system permease protein
MRALEYALREGVAGLLRHRAASVLAVAAIALAVVVLGALLLITSNAEQIVARWTAAAEFSVYLSDEATSEQRGVIEDVIDRSGVAQAREYVSKAQALARFRTEFAELVELAEGFDDNPFPASIEVRVIAAAERDGTAEALVRKLVALPGVADVRYDRDWLERVSAGVGTLRSAGLALALLMAVAAAVTVSMVVRLGLHARREEVQVMELVGAPLTYIRGPLVAEGFLQGGAGSALAMVVLWVGFAAANAAWGEQVGIVLGGQQLQFLPLGLALSLIAGGMAVGSAGGYLAGRHPA